MFWPEEDLPAKGAVVVLADQDLLLPVDLIRSHCAANLPKIRLLNHPAHGGSPEVPNCLLCA